MAMLLTAVAAPEKWATGGQAIEISENISEFAKLREAIGQELESLEAAHQPAGWERTAVTGRVSFGFLDAQSDDVIADIELRVVVPLVCQRCLEAFDDTLEVDAKLVFVRDGQTPEYPGREAWELDDDVVRPLDLADELLVMAMPFAALHEVANCSKGAADAAPAMEDTVRPFADLRAQMEAASTPDKPAED